MDAYGHCRLCSCSYMGPLTTCGGCTHEANDHVLLLKCTTCTCDGFESTATIPSCYNCGHSSCEHASEKISADVKEEWLKKWSLEGKSRSEMKDLYNKQFGLSIRKLKKLLALYKIKMIAQADEDKVAAIIKDQNKLGVVGYKRLHRILRCRYRLNVSRKFVQQVIEKYNLPKGEMGQKKYHQKPFLSKGPNWLWAMDGHEKLAQPFGLYIYGVLDTFSRKIISLKALPSKSSACVHNWLLKTFHEFGGQPKRIMADKGREFCSLIQEIEIIQLSSVFNQKIEALWSQLQRHSDMFQYKSILRTLEQDGLFEMRNPLHKYCVWQVFGQMVQRSLDNFLMTHNLCKIRKQKKTQLPTGATPNDMFTYPELYNSEDHRKDLQLTDFNPVQCEEEAYEQYSLPHWFDKSVITKETAIDVYKALIDHFCTPMSIE